jgi:beta-lactamase regulating signal transducer with metallopeptidase domain/sporulation protein YlmC with PRC-barrel domain
MTHLAPWLSPVTMRLLALALLHFLWQGTVLAAVGYAAMTMFRNASTRYAVGVGMLVLMLAAPVCTFVVLRGQGQANMTSTSEVAPTSLLPAIKQARQTSQFPAREGYSAAYSLWLVEGWFLGVLLLSMRSVGGFLLIERLRRKERVPLNEELLGICRSLQQRMGLKTVVRYCESMHLEAPAVAGWIRPVVLLPLRALSGLSGDEVEAVIAHELAHIRRFDAFVNVFQVALETLLFYHPAVWWMSKQVRAEREHCCDDIAVSVCGSAVTYAHALAHMAEGPRAPEFAMAANGGPLVARVARLLGAKQASDSLRGATISGSVVFLAAALVAGSALLGSVHKAHAQAPAPAAAHPAKPVVAPAIPVAPQPSKEAFTVRANAAQETEVAPKPEQPAVEPDPEAAQQAPRAPQTGAATPKQSYIDSLKDAGLTDLSVDELIALKVQDVTGEYVKAMKALLKVGPEELIGMKVQGITPEYVKQMRDATGQNLGVQELIGMKVQGISGDYLKQMHDLGFATQPGEIIGMKVQGVTAEYVRSLRALGLKVDAGEVIGLKVQGVTPEYVKGIQDLGLHPDTGEIIGMKVQGVTPEYLKALQAAGFKLDAGEAIGAKVQGITPEFIEKARGKGFKNLTLDKLIALKQSGVLDDEK